MLQGFAGFVLAASLILACSSDRDFSKSNAGSGGAANASGSGGSSGSGGASNGGAGGGGTSSGGAAGQSGAAGQGGDGGTAGAAPNGDACTADASCASGFCRDGVCCDGDCSDTCRACAEAQTGQPSGRCELVSSGLDPHDDCEQSAASTCGDDGSCDGAGACRKYGANQVCGAASCSESEFRPERTCDGEGSCAPAAAVECGANPCTATGCAAPCGGDMDCPAQSYCAANMVCSAKKTDGAACALGRECRSGNCVDGVCCDGACGGSCVACAESKTGQTSGRCLPVPAGQDPDSECAVDAANACGLDGACNGSGACRVQPSGAPCGTASCSGSTLTPAGTCDGQSSCTPSSPRACPGGLNCASATACTTSCTSSTGCAPGNYCSAGMCLPKKGTGVACGAAGECVSGYCVDGTCCGSACTLSCRGCSNAATGLPDGTCGQRTASATQACPTSNPTACIDTQTSATNCGACGVSCPGTPGVAGTSPACRAGTCSSVCNDANRQICGGFAPPACVQASWSFQNGDPGFWNSSNETSSQVVANHGRTDNWSLQLYASFNPMYPAQAFTVFCYGDGASAGGGVDLRGKTATGYVYLQGLSYGGYPARCRLFGTTPDFVEVPLPWTNTPALNTWVRLSGTFGSRDSAIAQVGVECDLPPAWNDGSGTATERWYVDDVRISN